LRWFDPSGDALRICLRKAFASKFRNLMIVILSPEGAKNLRSERGRPFATLRVTRNF